MTYTPEQLREVAKWLNSDSKDEGPDIPLLSDIFYGYAAALEEIERLKKERDTAEYKALHREEMFNQRTSLMRDLQRDAMKADARAERAEAALAESERKIERLKFHAEGMWLDLKTIAHEEQYALAKSAADYRAEFKEE